MKEQQIRTAVQMRAWGTVSASCLWLNRFHAGADTAIANLPPLDAVADTVGGRTAEKLIAKVKAGGVYASVVGAPQNAAEYPSVKVVTVFSKIDRKTLDFMAEAVRDGKLVIPIRLKLPLSEAAEAQATAEKGGAGKILLVA